MMTLTRYYFEETWGIDDVNASKITTKHITLELQ